MLEIINIIFTIIDFVSDILVGIGLYYACHYNFAYCSFTLSALPSILILIFLLISCICPCKDRMTMYVKHHSGLYPGGLIGLIFIRPLYTIIMRIQECCREDKYGLQTRLGLKVLEILSQSEVCVHFFINLFAQLNSISYLCISFSLNLYLLATSELILDQDILSGSANTFNLMKEFSQ